MCSTPRPKRVIKVKASTTVGGILSTMSSKQRQSFAERANMASNRRIKVLQLKQAEQKRINQLKISSTHKKTKADENQPWLYWLLNASIGDIFRKMIFAK